MLEIRKSSFYPICKMDDKHNYKPYNLIHKDGTIFERIFLEIPNPSLREYIICLHYFKHQVKAFSNEPIAINVISRDEPWDFKIETDKKKVFNIEITAIADNKFSFEKMKREERLLLKSNKKELPIHELIKLNSFFPTEKMTHHIEELLNKNYSKKDIVDNPYYGNYPNLFISESNVSENNLESLLEIAITKKEQKKHKEKDKTVLLIDNRTLAYEISDFFEAFKNLDELINNISFREIWLYTGYCSDNDGNNAEFSLAPIKITQTQSAKLAILTEKNRPDKDNIIFI